MSANCNAGFLYAMANPFMPNIYCIRTSNKTPDLTIINRTWWLPASFEVIKCVYVKNPSCLLRSIEVILSHAHVKSGFFTLTAHQLDHLFTILSTNHLRYSTEDADDNDEVDEDNETDNETEADEDNETEADEDNETEADEDNETDNEADDEDNESDNEAKDVNVNDNNDNTSQFFADWTLQVEPPPKNKNEESPPSPPHWLPAQVDSNQNYWLPVDEPTPSLPRLLQSNDNESDPETIYEVESVSSSNSNSNSNPPRGDDPGDITNCISHGDIIIHIAANKQWTAVYDAHRNELKMVTPTEPHPDFYARGSKNSVCDLCPIQDFAASHLRCLGLPYDINSWKTCLLIHDSAVTPMLTAVQNFFSSRKRVHWLSM